MGPSTAAPAGLAGAARHCSRPAPRASRRERPTTVARARRARREPRRLLNPTATFREYPHASEDRGMMGVFAHLFGRVPAAIAPLPASASGPALVRVERAGLRYGELRAL